MKKSKLIMVVLSVLVCVYALIMVGGSSAKALANDSSRVFAEENAIEDTQVVEDNAKGSKAISAAIAIGAAAFGSALAMGYAIAKSVEGISKQPEAQSSIRGSLMIGLVFIETVVIYALIVAILVIFVL